MIRDEQKKPIKKLIKPRKPEKTLIEKTEQ